MYLHVQSCQTKRLKQVLLKIILNNASSNWWRHSHLKAKHFINKIAPWSKCSIAQRNIKVPFLLKLWNVENFLWKLSSSKLWPFYILYSNLQWTIKNGKFPNYITIISQIVAFNWTLLLVMEYYTPGYHLKGKNECFKLILYIF